MQSEIESIKRLKNPKAKVSCHYFINRKGNVIQMVKDLNIAWHAGKSKWKNFSNLNRHSLGIELVNKGHDYGYQNFTNLQIKSLIQLCKILKKKYTIKKENFLGHSDIAPQRKKDPGEKFPWKKLSRHNIGKWYKNEQYDYKFSKKNKEISFFKNLKKLGYRYFDINKRNHKDKKVIKIFQQHYLPKNVTGKIDEKTFNVSQLLILS
tara:strand:- start:420 stop:1040 length:621 start_codon:yes stop_codon:yes gene_type:complete